METKNFDCALEVKELTESGQFSGYASIFSIKDYDNDIVLPGAFRKSLAAHRRAKTMPKMLWQHMSAHVPGVFMHFEEDEKGLLNEGQLLLDTQLGRETYSLLKAKAIDGQSIGYVVEKADPRDEATGTRVIKQVDLWEVSLVTFPANPAARVALVKQCAPDGIKTIREFEDFLRDVGGFSNAQAKAIASRGFKPTDDHRDGDVGLEELAQLIHRNINILRGN